ncbi:hypothetical protein B0H15DRAFT_802255 [Mycena belliarum]|uniref:Ribonuclease H1 N-terminal domain-containing protein n=1 Tax=Mycena belliarum TaxID=1033014 RepID=A0AAD6XSW6_9AGAR|nr:hypothetical protein B0H15DRAFT_802255 [Mycena belliae]
MAAVESYLNISAGAHRTLFTNHQPGPNLATPSTMSLPDLSPAEIADLIRPSNHPSRLSADELDRLTANLNDQQLEEVIDRLGLADLAQQLPPLFSRVILAAQRVVRETPPENDNDIERIIRDLDVVHIANPPLSSPQGPSTQTTSPNSESVPSTPPPSGRFPSYAVTSPTQMKTTVSWLEVGALTQGVAGASVRGTPGRRRDRKPPSAAYTVFFGGEVGVFDSWDDAKRSITGHGIAIHCGFPSIAAAHAALDYARARGWTADSTSPTPALPLPSSYEDNALNSQTSTDRWYAVCCGVAPGVYRSYLECALNTVGIRGNRCSSFKDRAAAEKAFAHATKVGWCPAQSCNGDIGHTRRRRALDVVHLIAALSLGWGALVYMSLYPIEKKTQPVLSSGGHMALKMTNSIPGTMLPYTNRVKLLHSSVSNFSLGYEPRPSSLFHIYLDPIAVCFNFSSTGNICNALWSTKLNSETMTNSQLSQIGSFDIQTIRIPPEPRAVSTHLYRGRQSPLNEHRHPRLLLSPRHVALGMPSRKPKATEEELRDRRADAAWAYRQRNQESINAKARARMKQRRADLKNAPSAVQQEERIRANRYRRHYRERTREPPKLPTTNKHHTPRPAKPMPTSSQPVPTSSQPVPERAPTAPQKTGLPRATATASYVAATASWVTEQSRRCALRQSASKSLTAIDTGDSQSEEEVEEQSSQSDTREDLHWDADDEDDEDNLGPLLDRTGRADYVPLPGQQPYMKGGRRYWF